MNKTASLSSLDLRYEDMRLKNPYQEKQLLDSIIQKGIIEPVVVSGTDDSHYIVLDGFKRIRCLNKIKTYTVPIVTYGETEADSILKLLKIGLEKSIATVEQAAFVNELQTRLNLSLTEIAYRLEVSKAWVSVRLGIWEEMSPLVREKIFSGKFPLRSYMYTIKQFTRVNTKDKKKDIDNFINLTSGKKLSTREIDVLAKNYFKGDPGIKKQIEEGDINWTARALINQEKSDKANSDAESTHEINVISNLRKLVYLLITVRSIFTEQLTKTSGNLVKRISPIMCQIIENMEKLSKVMEGFDGQ